MRKPIAALAAVLIGVLVSIGSGGASGSAGAAGPLRMTVATTGNIGSLDLRHGDSVIAREVWNLQYPTLTALDPTTLAPTTGIASAWSPLAAGHGWTYSLRPGQTWSDGQPVTATDVVYSFDHARNDHWPYAEATLGGLSSLSIHEVDAHTVDITSNRPYDPPGLLLHIVPAHVYSRFTDISSNVAALGVGDGAWHVIATSPTAVELGVLGRPGGPPLDQIVFTTYKTPDALIDAISHRKVDVISGLPYADITRLDAMPKLTVDHAPDGTEYVLFAHPPGEPTRAVSLAIDRTALVAAAVDGVGTPAAVSAEPDAARASIAPSSGTTQLNIEIPTDALSRRVGDLVGKALDAAGFDVHIIAVSPGEKIKQRVDFQLLRAVAGHAGGAIPLFEPDTLQAFRTDNVTGFLREPSQRSLVVFGPTVAQYASIAAAQPPPGEQLGNGTYAAGAAVLLVICAAGYWVASRLRRRFVT